MGWDAHTNAEKNWDKLFLSNEEHKKKIHGIEPGYFFFDNKEKANDYLQELKRVEIDLQAFYLCHTIEEGKHVRYKTIAQMFLQYKGKNYYYEHDLGYAYPTNSAEFMFTDGDYSCDCNLSLFLKEEYGDEIEELECGQEIDILNLNIVQIKQ